MPLAVVVDGKAVEVTEPRVCRMIEALVRREEQIRQHKLGHVEFHYGAPSQQVRTKVTDEDSG